jgi:hypothetical protein
MRRILGVTLAAVLNGCGGGPPPNYDASFAGVWAGTVTETDAASGESLGNFQEEILVEATGSNLLELNNFCDGVGPTVTVTSATQFSGNIPFACRPQAGGDCAAIVAKVTSVSGTLNGTTLAFEASVTFAGCGATEGVTLSFSGTRALGY